MPEIEVFEDKSILVGKRRKGRDETVEDALKTMERFSDWLARAREQNPWLQTDAVHVTMLYGMLLHVRDEVDRLLALGGDEARNAYEFFKGGERRNEEGNRARDAW